MTASGGAPYRKDKPFGEHHVKHRVFRLDAEDHDEDQLSREREQQHIKQNVARHKLRSKKRIEIQNRDERPAYRPKPDISGEPCVAEQKRYGCDDRNRQPL